MRPADLSTYDHRLRWSLLQAAARRSFGVDLRSLALFRIALGVLLLVDLSIRVRSLSAHYTDQGIMPRALRIAMYDYGDIAGEGSYWWSLHLMNGQTWFQGLLFAIAAVAAVCLIAGFRTRAATLVSWLLLISLHSRFPDILNGGDSLLALLLFWSLFLPMGAEASLDSLCKNATVRRDKNQRYLSVATAGLLMQIVAVYLVNAIVKTGTEWTTDFTAVHYALHFDLYVTETGQRLAQFSQLLSVLSCATYYLELIVPLVALSPIANRWCRPVAVSIMITFHLGLASCLELGLFPYISIAAWLLLLPAEFWQASARATRGVRRLLGPLNAPILSVASSTGPYAAAPSLRLRPISNVLLILVVCNLVALNVRHVYEVCILAEESEVRPLAWWEIPQCLGRLDQRWSMFAPSPPTNDGWFVIEGTLRNGARVDAWRPKQPLSFDKPTLVSAEYSDHRWRKYFANLRRNYNRGQVASLSDWMRRRWNRLEAEGDPNRELVAIACHFQSEPTVPPGESAVPAVSNLLWEIDYEPAADASTESLSKQPTIPLPRNETVPAKSSVE